VCNADAACSEPIRAACAALLAETEARLPTVVFSVTDAEGAAVTAVKVFSNDSWIAERLDGTPVAVNPGEHRFRFLLPSGEVSSIDARIVEGERARRIAIRMQQPPNDFNGPGTVPLVMSPPNESSPTSPSGVVATTTAARLPTSFWVASGVSAAALLSFGTFALLGRSIHYDIADCSPDCGPDRRDDFDALRRNYALADVFLGVAGVSAGAAAYFYFTAPKHAAPPTNVSRVMSRLRVVVTPPTSTERPALVGVHGAF
jgi:hypothetical protein